LKDEGCVSLSILKRVFFLLDDVVGGDHQVFDCVDICEALIVVMYVLKMKGYDWCSSGDSCSRGS
jgi:hypothetical protein